LRSGRAKDLSGLAITKQLNEKILGNPGRLVAIFPPPPVQGLGTVVDSNCTWKTARGWAEPLYKETTAAIGKGLPDTELTGLFSSFDVNVPQIDAHVDREKAKTFGISLDDVFRNDAGVSGALT